MNYGFRLVYDKDIPAEDMEDVLDMLSAKKEHFTGENSYKVGWTSSHSFYRRGIFGLRVQPKGGSYSSPAKYTFKRLTKGRRIFGVVPVDKLERLDNQEIEQDNCICADHRGGQRVRLKSGFREADYVTYFETGEIKG